MRKSRTAKAIVRRLRALGFCAGVTLFVTACVTADPNTDADSDRMPRSFAAAIETHRPLGRVAGDLSPLTSGAEPLSAPLLSEAVKYAETMQSYSLIVWHKGVLRLERYFDGHDASLRSESASMHKTVLGLSIAAAIDDGYIESADDSACDYLPEWQGSERCDIRIRDLLTMASGLRPLSYEGGRTSEAYRFFLEGEQARSKILSLQLVTKPGGVFWYANTNSQLLGMILENATGQNYEDYLSTRIWQPIGAADAYVWYNETDSFPRTYSALLARARDWLKVGLLIKNYGRVGNAQIIPEHLVRDMTSPSSANSSYGWQLWLGKDTAGSRYYNDDNVGLVVAQSEDFVVDDLIFLDGIGGQRVYVSRSNDLVIVRLGENRLDWDDSILPNRVAAALLRQ